MAQGKILIIDDDPDITEAMAVVLGNKGYQVASAANSTEGMEQLKKQRPDLDHPGRDDAHEPGGFRVF